MSKAEIVYFIVLGGLVVALICACLYNVCLVLRWAIEDWFDRDIEKRCSSLCEQIQEERNALTRERNRL